MRCWGYAGLACLACGNPTGKPAVALHGGPGSGCGPGWRRFFNPGETLVPLGAERFEIARALAHGHVAAVLGTVRRLGLDKALPKGPERRAKLILAMIVARIIEPAAKLATARQLSGRLHA
jgi:hypothetical protein